MTTIVTVTNEGPEVLEIRYFKSDRTLSEEITRLEVGRSERITVWDGHLPVFWQVGSPLTGNKFSAIPPAHM